MLCSYNNHNHTDLIAIITLVPEPKPPQIPLLPSAKQFPIALQIVFIIYANTLFGQTADSAFTSSIPATDTIWGTEIKDTYRWLESLESDTVKDWLKKQRKLTKDERMKCFGKYTDAYARIQKGSGAQFPQLTNDGKYLFYNRWISEYTPPALYYKEGVDAPLMEAYNPNHDRYPKNPVSIENFILSPDGRYLALLLSVAGSDWRTIRVRDLKKSRDLPEVIEWVKFSNLEWTDSGFFYSRFKEPPKGQIHTASNTHQQLYFHRLGESVEMDRLIYTVADKSNSSMNFELTSNKRYLIIYSVAKLGATWCNTLMYKDLNEGMFSELKMFAASPVKKDFEFDVIDYVNGAFAVRTNFDAPHYRTLLYEKDSVNRAQELIPEYKEILQSVYNIGGKLLCRYYNRGTYAVSVFNYDGENLYSYKFPTGYSLGGFWGLSTDTSVRFYQSTYYLPPVVFTFNLNSFNIESAGITDPFFDTKRYVTRVVNYKSKDGTLVPMYLTHKKGLKPSKSNPVILYGYGGFGVSLTPSYKYSNIILFENNGILAVPLIRGGGELGKDWHVQGKGLNKQNSFDDFIRAAEYLIDSGYTSPERIAIEGGSNGGLLVGAMLTQRPDLFKVAIGKMGVYDMLRYHLFTGARFIEEEYGTIKDSIQFINLLKYSPLHCVKKNVDYPATLLITGENDDRVPPFHSYKFVSALQQNASNSKPHILYYEEDGGHHGAEGYEYALSKEAFILAFIFKQMGIELVTEY